MTRDTKIVAGFVAAVALAVLAASVVCAWAIAHGASPKWKLLFRFLCHGLPERSFPLFETVMPICARCSGIYAGLLVGVAVFVLWPRIEERVARIVLYVAVTPLAIDGLTQAVGLRESTNALRVATGIAAALSFGLWALSAVERRPIRAVTPS